MPTDRSDAPGVTALSLDLADHAADLATCGDLALPLAPGVVRAIADFVRQHAAK